MVVARAQKQQQKSTSRGRSPSPKARSTVKSKGAAARSPKTTQRQTMIGQLLSKCTPVTTANTYLKGYAGADKDRAAYKKKHAATCLKKPSTTAKRPSVDQLLSKCTPVNKANTLLKGYAGADKDRAAYKKRHAATCLKKPSTAVRGCLSAFLNRPASELSEYARTILPGFKFYPKQSPMRITRRVGPRDIYAEINNGIVVRIVCGADIQGPPRPTADPLTPFAPLTPLPEVVTLPLPAPTATTLTPAPVPTTNTPLTAPTLTPTPSVVNTNTNTIDIKVTNPETGEVSLVKRPIYNDPLTGPSFVALNNQPTPVWTITGAAPTPSTVSAGTVATGGVTTCACPGQPQQPQQPLQPQPLNPGIVLPPPPPIYNPSITAIPTAQPMETAVPTTNPPLVTTTDEAVQVAAQKRKKLVLVIVGLAILLAVGAGVAWYLARRRRGSGAGSIDDSFGLSDGELGNYSDFGGDDVFDAAPPAPSRGGGRRR